MTKESALAKKTAIYAVGNFGSKILSYVMVLVYSYYIAPEDMGYYDVILSTISMMQPLILFQINDGVYRHLLDAKDGEHHQIIGNGFRFLCMTTLLSEFLFAVFCAATDVLYAGWIGGLLASTIVFVYFQDVVRGLGKSKLYAALGILNSVVMLGCEVICLILLKMGVVALIISKILANCTCVLVICCAVKDIKQSMRQKMQKNTMLPLLRYSAPLVPNTISWWVVNSSNRYIILGFLGVAYNGIFSMATKFPTVLTTITSIFYLAWQDSAVKEYNSPNRDAFFSSIFRKYYVLLFTLCLCAVPATRLVVELFVSVDYKEAWQYTGFLYLGAAFSALCSFLGIGYQISKETARSFYTSVIAAVINVSVNFLLIQVIGLQAASFATFISYFCLFWIRIRHTKRYFHLQIEWKLFALLFLIILALMVATRCLSSIWMCLVLCLASVGILLGFNRETFLPIIKKVLKR